ncbi:MAG: ABC transporter substrate-binding protein [Longimicrobiales bacterium]
MVDDRGRAHSPETGRSRIVSLVPGITETLVAIGATGTLIARTDYDTQGALQSLPSVGGGLDPSLEFLVDLGPDLVIMWPDRGGAGSLSARLEELGIDVYQAEVEGMADFRRHARNAGVLTGRRFAADSLVDWVDSGLARVASEVSSQPPSTLFYMVQQDPPMGAGPGTFLDSLMTVAGGRNVLSDAVGQWPLVSVEDVLWKDPNYIVVPVLELQARKSDDTVTQLAASPGWREVGAVREGRVFAVDAELFGRAGPRMAEAAEALARRLHPAVYEHRSR